jgi:hypothetical protein
MTKRLAAPFRKGAASLFTVWTPARVTLPRFLPGRSSTYSELELPGFPLLVKGMHELLRKIEGAMRHSPSLSEREGTGGMAPETEHILLPSSNHMDTLPPGSNHHIDDRFVGLAARLASDIHQFQKLSAHVELA